MEAHARRAQRPQCRKPSLERREWLRNTKILTDPEGRRKNLWEEDSSVRHEASASGVTVYGLNDS